MKIRFAAAAVVFLTGSVALAAPTNITGTFFPAVDGVNSFQASDGVSTFSSTTSTTGLWHDRVGVFDIVGLPSPASGAYQGQALTSNLVVTTITGLNPGWQYNIDIIHGVHTGPVGGLQDIDAGFSPGAMTTFLEANSTLTGDLLMAGGFWNVAEQHIGTATADGNGEIDVYVNYAAGVERTVYNGLAYTAIPPGTGYCFGDGAGTTCPCGNVGASGAGCANSTGSGGVLTESGTVSVLADDLTFLASGLLPNQSALLFVGLNAVNTGNGLIFGDGLRCAGGSIVRLGVRVPDAGGVANWGPGLGASGGWVSGDTRYFQTWYRDPSGSPCGSGFNLTNGVALTFQN